MRNLTSDEEFSWAEGEVRNTSSNADALIQREGRSMRVCSIECDLGDTRVDEAASVMTALFGNHRRRSNLSIVMKIPVDV